MLSRLSSTLVLLSLLAVLSAADPLSQEVPENSDVISNTNAAASTSCLIPLPNPVSAVVNSVQCLRHKFPTHSQLAKAKTFLGELPAGTVFNPTWPKDNSDYGEHNYLKDARGTLWHYEQRIVSRGHGCVRKAFLLEKSLSRGYPSDTADVYVVKEVTAFEHFGFRKELDALRTLGRLIGSDALITGDINEHSRLRYRLNGNRFRANPDYERYPHYPRAIFFQKFFPGKVLRDTSPTIPPSHRKMIKSKAMAALRRFHEAGWAYRNIDSANLMIRPVRRFGKIVDFEVTLLDFHRAERRSENPYTVAPENELEQLRLTLKESFGDQSNCKVHPVDTDW